MNTCVWGPKYWRYLFDVAYHFDETIARLDTKVGGGTDDTKAASALARANIVGAATYLFEKSLGDALPCAICRRNYERHLKDTPPRRAIKSGKLFTWLYALKNQTIKDKAGAPGTVVAAPASTSERVVRARHSTVVSGQSTPDDLVFIVYATLCNQFTRTRNDDDDDDYDDVNAALSCKTLETYFGAVFRLAALVPALRRVVDTCAYAVLRIYHDREDTDTDNDENYLYSCCLQETVAVVEGPYGRSAKQVLKSFLSLCSDQLRARAWKKYNRCAQAL